MDTQVVVDAAGDDEDARARALDFADLALAYRVMKEGGPKVPMAAVEEMIGLHSAAEAG